MWGGWNAAMNAWSQNLTALPVNIGSVYLVLPIPEAEAEGSVVDDAAGSAGADGIVNKRAGAGNAAGTKGAQL